MGGAGEYTEQYGKGKSQQPSLPARPELDGREAGATEGEGGREGGREGRACAYTCT